MSTIHSASPRSAKVTWDGVGLGFSSFSSTFTAAASDGGGFLVAVFVVVDFFFREKSGKFSSSLICSSMSEELDAQPL